MSMLSSTLPTLEELYHPREALKRRLLANTSLTGSVAVQILRMEEHSLEEYRRGDNDKIKRPIHDFDPLNDIAKKIYERAIQELVMGVQRQVLMMKRDYSDSTMPSSNNGATTIVTKDLDQNKAKARTLFDAFERLSNRNSTMEENCISIDNDNDDDDDDDDDDDQEKGLLSIVSKMHEYLDVSPIEAKEVIGHLRHLVHSKAAEQRATQQLDRVRYWDKVDTMLTNHLPR
ncbi:hypothetical protein BGZ94_002388 [Podila epigama]|nr:hypothetical protein BGZ94_002388 [Podila epigama]